VTAPAQTDPLHARKIRSVGRLIMCRCKSKSSDCRLWAEAAIGIERNVRYYLPTIKCEQVYAIWDIYDGVRTGIADFNGAPQYVASQFDEEAGDYSDNCRLGVGR